MVGCVDGVDNGCDYRIVNYSFDDYHGIMVRVVASTVFVLRYINLYKTNDICMHSSV